MLPPPSGDGEDTSCHAPCRVDRRLLARLEGAEVGGLGAGRGGDALATLPTTAAPPAAVARRG